MSEPGLSEPPTKRQRADKEDAKKDGKGKEPDDDEEFHQLTAVSVVQEELNVLDEEEAQEVLIVHKAYLKRKRPLYARRQEAIAKVPNFWLKVLLAYPLTQPYVSDCDQFALKFLEAISVSKALVVPTLAGIPQQKQEPSEEEGANDAVKAKGVVVVGGKKESDADGDDGEGDDDDDDGVAFRVVFTFKENPFFSNKQLWKEWESPEAQQAAFSEVDWKDTEEAKELQSFLVWNLDPNAAEESDTPSFFSIFCEDVEDYELGELLRGEITDNPLDIYLRHDFEETDEADQEGLLPQEAFAENGKPGSGEDYPEEDDLDDAEEAFDDEEDHNGHLEDETE